jgi:hypothetical protein
LAYSVTFAVALPLSATPPAALARRLETIVPLVQALRMLMRGVWNWSVHCCRENMPPSSVGGAADDDTVAPAASAGITAAVATTTATAAVQRQSIAWTDGRTKGAPSSSVELSTVLRVTSR